MEQWSMQWEFEASARSYLLPSPRQALCCLSLPLTLQAPPGLSIYALTPWPPPPQGPHWGPRHRHRKGQCWACMPCDILGQGIGMVVPLTGFVVPQSLCGWLIGGEPLSRPWLRYVVHHGTELVIPTPMPACSSRTTRFPLPLAARLPCCVGWG